MRAGVSVTAAKHWRIASWAVIWATWSPHVGDPSMSPLPRPYQGSITQSWPKATGMPDASIRARVAAAPGVGVVASLQG